MCLTIILCLSLHIQHHKQILLLTFAKISSLYPKREVEDKRTGAATPGTTKKNYLFENFLLLLNVEIVALEILVKLRENEE